MIALNPNIKPERGPETGTVAPAAFATPERWLEAQRRRYAVKQYDASRAIDAETWDALEESLVLTPSGIGLQPWKFIVVDDPATRARLREVSYGQPQITDAAKIVVFAARTGYSEMDVDRFIARVAEVRGVSVESLAGLRQAAMSVVARPEADRDAWAARQAYIALGNFIASAAALGVDATPMEGLQPAKYDEILNLPAQGYRALAVAAAGYRSPEDKYASLPKVRFARETVVGHV
jgi:nitroreductase